jgi:hypothetical protein
MHTLNTIIQTATAALATGRMRYDTPDTSLQYACEWQRFILDVSDPTGYRRKIQSEIAAGLPPAYPSNPIATINNLSGHVAAMYIFCGFDIAEITHDMPGDHNDVPRKNCIASAISDHTSHILCAIDKINHFTASQSRLQDLDLQFKQALGEFYALSILALRETKPYIHPAEHTVWDKTIRHCNAQLMRYHLTRLTSPDMEPRNTAALQTSGSVTYITDVLRQKQLKRIASQQDAQRGQPPQPT